MSEQPDDRQAPRLQNTTERDALPLPLPDEPGPVEPVDEPAAVEEPVAETSEPEPPAEPSPSPVEEPGSQPEPVVDPPAPAADGDGTSSGHDAGPPPFEPAPSVAGLAESDQGPPLELLIGAAFVGGVALAFLIKRLGS